VEIEQFYVEVSRLVLGRCLFRVSAGTQAIQTEVFRGFP
jgi:hypothetical protein